MRFSLIGLCYARTRRRPMRDRGSEDTTLAEETKDRSVFHNRSTIAAVRGRRAITKPLNVNAKTSLRTLARERHPERKPDLVEYLHFVYLIIIIHNRNIIESLFATIRSFILSLTLSHSRSLLFLSPSVRRTRVSDAIISSHIVIITTIVIIHGPPPFLFLLCFSFCYAV